MIWAAIVWTWLMLGYLELLIAWWWGFGGRICWWAGCRFWSCCGGSGDGCLGGEVNLVGVMSWWRTFAWSVLFCWVVWLAVWDCMLWGGVLSVVEASGVEELVGGDGGWLRFSRVGGVYVCIYVDAVGEEFFGGGLSYHEYSDEVGRIVGAPDSDEGKSAFGASAMSFLVKVRCTRIITRWCFPMRYPRAELFTFGEDAWSLALP